MGFPCPGGSQPTTATIAPAWGRGRNRTLLPPHILGWGTLPGPLLEIWVEPGHACLGTQGHPWPEAKRHMPMCSQEHVVVMRTETHMQTHTEFTHTGHGPLGWGGKDQHTAGGRGGAKVLQSISHSLSSGCPALPP